MEQGTGSRSAIAANFMRDPKSSVSPGIPVNEASMTRFASMISPGNVCWMIERRSCLRRVHESLAAISPNAVDATIDTASSMALSKGWTSRKPSLCLMS